jgi:S1-C subfamily serine protease
MAPRLLERLRSPLLVLAGAGLGLLLMFAYLQLNPPGGRYNDNDIRKLAQERIDAITPTPPLAPVVAAKLRPSVVQISTDQQPNGNRNTRGLGSGVVVDANGTILTSYHVVVGAASVNVRFYDGTVTRGTVSQVLPERDLAMVQVSRLPNGIDPAVLGGGVGEGDEVLAIGSPFGLEGSVSRGVVSGVQRRFVVEMTGQVLDNMIQFDAAVNPGNSGGPLVDLNGRVVGIVTGIVNPTGSVFIGLGFAVPIEAASGIMAPLD